MESGGGVTEHYMRGRCNQFAAGENPAAEDPDWETQLAHTLFHAQQAALDAAAELAAAAGWDSDEGLV